MERGFEYNRGIDANNSISSFELAVIYDLNGGDCVGVQVKTYDADEGDTNLVEFGYTVIGDDSFIEIVKHGGIAGAVGPTGPAGLDGTGADNQTAAEVTVSTTNFGVNLSSADDSVQEALDTSTIWSVVAPETLLPLPRPATVVLLGAGTPGLLPLS